MAIVLGVSASLRNARLRRGTSVLCDEVLAVESRDGLDEYLKKQTRLRVDSFIEAGRAENKSFDEIYSALRRMSGEQGLSNSEAGLAAALWGASQTGIGIDHLSLAEHFLPSGRINDPDEMKNKVLACDAMIIATPVYFGDRSSLAQSFIEFCAADKDITRHLHGKLYAGIAVGAKRNGGQETTLIYQLLDMVNMSMLAVGNSSETTAQYGGTIVAGDVGMGANDDYGLNTSIGTGRRIGEVARMLEAAKKVRLDGKMKIQMWLLQDATSGEGVRYFEQWRQKMHELHPDLHLSLHDMTRELVHRCIGCDLCPIDVGPRRDYRCIISAKRDYFKQHHEELCEADAILVCAYSPRDRSQVRSVYQQFIERTRYLRRDNYMYSNILATPFVLSELSARQNLHLRMITSIMRHNTVIHHPLIGMMRDGEVLNQQEVEQQGVDFIAKARNLMAGNIDQYQRQHISTAYQPVGYKISLEKMQEDVKNKRVATMVEQNKKEIEQDRQTRFTLVPKEGEAVNS